MLSFFFFQGTVSFGPNLRLTIIPGGRSSVRRPAPSHVSWGPVFVVLLPIALNQRCPCPVVSQAGFAGKGGVATHLLGKGSCQARLLPNTQVGRVATCNGQGGGKENIPASLHAAGRWGGWTPPATVTWGESYLLRCGGWGLALVVYGRTCK